jgi:Saccharopine dehydrogenase NADP binding domain
MKSYNVAVYGATGHTGRFVASELERRSVAVRRIARQPPAESSSQEDGGLFTWVGASCDDPEALDRALDGTDAVINCAGPFLDTAPAVIEAALRAGAHYLDIAAEQRSVRQSFATYHAEARDVGVVVLPAMAFYGGLADLLVAQLCTGLRKVDEILIGVALDYWHPTAGTRRTGERNTARRVIVSGGRLAPLPTPAARGRWQFPLPFGDLPVASVPLSEIITISRHITANRIESFMNEAPLKDLGKADTPPPTSAEASGRSTQTFVMDVFASGEGLSRRLAAFGRDIYAVSAPLVVEACMRVLSQTPRKGGTFAPAELFDPQDFLAAPSLDIRLESISQPCPMGNI